MTQRAHPDSIEPLVPEKEQFEASYAMLKMMERNPGDCARMVAEALETTATLLGSTVLAGRIWGLRDHLRTMVS